jgi:3-phosphoshikimate 1-carboxyvinyltransferase
MILEVKNIITGDFIAPKSKSIAIRAAFAAFLAKKQVPIIDYPKNGDSISALKLIQQLGGTVEFVGNDVLIGCDDVTFPREINCGESGLCLNFALALALKSKTSVKLTGERTLLSRNFVHIMSILINNNIRYLANGTMLPLTIFPDPEINLFRINGSKSSQLASGMLLSAMYHPDIKFEVTDLVSQGYFDMTRALFSDFGYTTIIENNSFSLIKTAEPPDVYSIEGDWSSVANILVAAAISGDVTVRGLNLNSLQPDRAILDILKRVGAEVILSDSSINVKSRELHSFKQTIADCPDLFPILCVLAAYANGTSTIAAIQRLRHKETNRPLLMQEELRRAGVDFRFDNFTAEIKGGEPNGADFSSHNDHRIAMALTIASMFTSTQSTLSEPECVEKSYPDFFRDLGIQ